MARYSFTVGERFSADPRDVLALESDAARWAEWAGPVLRRFRWADDVSIEGSVGAVRELPLGPVALRERTTMLKPGSEHAYTMLPRWPFRDFVGRLSVRALPEGGGELEWSFSFRTRDPVVGVAT